MSIFLTLNCYVASNVRQFLSLLNMLTTQPEIDYFLETTQTTPFMHLISQYQQFLPGSCTQTRQSCTIIICHETVRSLGVQNGSLEAVNAC